MVAIAAMERFDVPGDWLTATLPRAAAACFELFCQIERTPAWLTVLRSAVVTERHADGRPHKAAFLASLQRATIGYNCSYQYRTPELRVSWSTAPRSSIVVRGMAQFQPLSPTTSLMTYCLDLRVGDGLPPFIDSSFGNHASAATLASFRDYATKIIV